MSNFDCNRIQYNPGDHLGLFSCNDEKIVNGILQRIETIYEANEIIELQTLKHIHTPNGKSS